MAAVGASLGAALKDGLWLKEGERDDVALGVEEGLGDGASDAILVQQTFFLKE